MVMVSTPFHLLPLGVLPLCNIHGHVTHSLLSEGCVRGHRATRCGHFERWMIRVKKPGRPLRKCPHVKRPCTCVQELVSMIKIPINTPSQILPGDLVLKLLKSWAA